jgi:hypothetical protein
MVVHQQRLLSRSDCTPTNRPNHQLRLILTVSVIQMISLQLLNHFYITSIGKLSSSLSREHEVCKPSSEVLRCVVWYKYTDVS